jgi:glycosyltransferase involved in cell wall biosynthesis
MFERSMKSILAQTFDDFEFIICDDGSNDKTPDILKKLQNSDSRIRLIRNEKNLGLAASLNRCIRISSGEYIARHDCDDLSAPDRLEKQVAYLDSNPDVSVLGTFVYLFNEKGIWGKARFPKKINKRDFLFSSPHQHGSVMLRKKALLEAGGYRVSKETRRCEDYDLFMRMHVFSGSANLEEYLYYFCEDKNTYKRRKYRYRIDETKVRFKGFKTLGLMPQGFLYAIKPLIIGLIPTRLLKWLKNKIFRRKIVCGNGELPPF